MNATRPLPLPPYGPAAGPEPAVRAGRASAWVPRFVVLLILCQVALLFASIGPFRILVRVAAFGTSLALLLLRGRGGRAHPAATAAIMVLVVVFFGLANPNTTNVTGGLAQAGLYAAVLAPLFWVPRLTIDLRVLRRTVMILWAFHTLSAAIGVMQVYRPGSFQPNLSSVVQGKGKGYVESLKITTATGARVFRPMGLTDVPGGAAISGLYAVLFGIGFFLTRRTPGIIAGAVASMGLGMMCLYLSQVRALLVMTGISIVAVLAVLAWRRDGMRLAALGSALAGMIVAGYVAAVSLAGPAVTRRLGTLVTSHPSALYYSNRGHFLQETLTEILPRFPFGAGLGKWGMMLSYFPGQPGEETYWVEVQWTGWIIDGGAPLTLAYVAALAVALWTAWGIARGRRGGGELPFWGAVVMAYGVGAVALTFSYPLFLGQAGMEFWLLNATLFAASRTVAPPPAPFVLHRRP
ncbi:MAG: hypothetical protein JWM27_501 [Gemmatimonadetes bacterium]|nr:hypothetical protein [Gemmatimonadota bacterium]